MIFKAPTGATHLDADEIAGLKFKHVTLRCELDELEQANIEQGLRWLKRHRRSDILSESTIRKLHLQLFGDVWEWAGTFRLTEKNIGIDPLSIPTQLHIHLNNVRYWTEKKVFSPLEAAARFHHRLVQIHLFPNGNGRHARIATDIFLEEYFGFPPIHWANGFDLQVDNERRAAYLQALRAADAGDFALLFNFVKAKA